MCHRLANICNAKWHPADWLTDFFPAFPDGLVTSPWAHTWRWMYNTLADSLTCNSKPVSFAIYGRWCVHKELEFPSRPAQNSPFIFIRAPFHIPQCLLCFKWITFWAQEWRTCFQLTQHQAIRIHLPFHTRSFSWQASNACFGGCRAKAGRTP